MIDNILIVIVFGCIAYVFVGLGISAHNADQRARQFMGTLDGRRQHTYTRPARQMAHRMPCSHRRPPGYPRRHNISGKRGPYA